MHICKSRVHFFDETVRKNEEFGEMGCFFYQKRFASKTDKGLYAEQWREWLPIYSLLCAFQFGIEGGDDETAEGGVVTGRGGCAVVLAV